MQNGQMWKNVIQCNFYQSSKFQAKKSYVLYISIPPVKTQISQLMVEKETHTWNHMWQKAFVKFDTFDKTFHFFKIKIGHFIFFYL